MLEQKQSNDNMLSFECETENIIVTLKPEFINRDYKTKLYIWQYHIGIINLRRHRVQLMHRYWEIYDSSGVVQTVDGEGVVGTQPIILPGEVFGYTSHVSMHNNSGIMRGSYLFQQLNDQTELTVLIPASSLDHDCVTVN